MSPSSYQASNRGDKPQEKTHSQSVDTAFSHSQSTVAKLLEGKGQDVISVRPNDTILTVVGILKEKSIGAVVVTDQNGAVRGILSERDIVRRMADTPGETLAREAQELMTENVLCCALEDSLVEVLKRMSDGRFRHMPVLEEDRLCGIVTVGDVVNFRLLELEYEALRMRQMIVG